MTSDQTIRRGRFLPIVRRRGVVGVVRMTLLLGALAVPTIAEVGLVVVAGGGWTGDSETPAAAAVAVDGAHILAVGDPDAMAALGSPSFIRRFPNGFLVPGLIDNHTHFNRAGALLLGVNLLAASDVASFIEAVIAAHTRLPPEAWMLDGDWGAYEAWEQGSTGTDDRADATRFAPDRDLFDIVLGGRPALLSRFDREMYLANWAALSAAGASCDWEGVTCVDGRMNGQLTPEAAARVRAVVPEKSFGQRLAEARVALERLAGFGVTSIHDITTPEQMRVFQHLRASGDLTVRVYARPTLDKWSQLDAVGIPRGFGDDWLEIGGLKGFVDGIMGNSTARFYEPYLTSGKRGSWREMMRPEGNMLELLLGADRAGYWPHVHAIGDEAIDTLLDLFAEVVATNPPRDRRFRVIHTQVLRGPEVAVRMAEMGVIAEVQPYHAIDDMRWMEPRIGDRSRWAYAFKTLHDAGVMLSFGSDWPGTNASWYPANPMQGIYAAVTRQTLDGEPAAGWYPQERVDLETALRAYTVNNAWAAGKEERLGSLTPGKLADFVVLDRDPFTIDPSMLDEVEVLLTVVGGRVVYEAPQP